MNIKHSAELLGKVRAATPLVFSITNVVVTNFTANGLLALGASPVMAYAQEEAADMARIAGALVLNIGTLTAPEVETMLIAGKAANVQGVPVILDPVGAGATAYRTETVQRILNEVKVSVLRGNAAEIANTIGENAQIKGVDASGTELDQVRLAVKAARKLGLVVAITGAEDVVSDGTATYRLRNGHPLLTKVTGTGCLLTSVVGAFAAVGCEALPAAVAALVYYGVAGEIAAARKGEEGPGSFQTELLNQLYLVSEGEIEKYGSIERVS